MNRNNLAAYRAGWMDGATGHAMNPTFSEHPALELRAAYEHGHGGGAAARRNAYLAAAKKYDVDLATAVLR